METSISWARLDCRSGLQPAILLCECPRGEVFSFERFCSKERGKKSIPAQTSRQSCIRRECETLSAACVVYPAPGTHTKNVALKGAASPRARSIKPRRMPSAVQDPQQPEQRTQPRNINSASSSYSIRWRFVWSCGGLSFNIPGHSPPCILAHLCPCLPTFIEHRPLE